MLPDQIERLKRDYTDKYVQLTGNRPDHARFGTSVGQVKTINMSGRALVEFVEFHKDIGWYDIDLDYLKVVDKPQSASPAKPKPAAKAAKPAAAKKGTAKGKLSPLEMARQMGGTKGSAPAAQEEPTDAGEKKLSPLEMARQMGGTKGGAKPLGDKQKPAAAKKAGLSPIEQLKQMGAKRGDEAKAAVGAAPASPAETKVGDKPAAKGASKLSPIEQLRQMGAKRGDEAKASLGAAEEGGESSEQQVAAGPAAKASSGLSPIEQLRQMGAKRGDEARAAVEAATPTKSTPEKSPAKTAGNKLSPIEILRQQGAKRGAEAAAAIAETAPEETAADAAPADTSGMSPIEILRKLGGSKGGAAGPPTEATAPAEESAPDSESQAAEPIPPEATPEPLRQAREMEASRGPASEAGFPTTADILSMAEGKKPLGWKPDPPESKLAGGGQTRIQGGRITGNNKASEPLSTADIWAISRGERRAEIEASSESESDTESVADPEDSAATDAPSGKLTTAEIIAKLRAQGGKS